MPGDSSPVVVQKKDNKARGLGLSFCVVVHSHLYWFYSILYIAYCRITFHKKPIPVTRRKSPDATHTKKIKHSHRRQAKRKSLTLQPKAVIIPPTKPKASTTKPTHPNTPPLQQKVSVLHAFRTLSSSSSHNSFNAHLLIKSHRKIPKRSNSTGHIRTRSVSGLLTAVEDTSSDESSIQAPSMSISKRHRAMGLLRSTFYRSHSTGHLKQGLDSSNSSLLEDEGIVVETKQRKRDTIFGITRKFSGRKNAPNIATTAAVQPFETGALPPKNKSKLFRNLPSWKKAHK